MKTLEEFWQRLRCCDKYHLSMQEVETLEDLILKAKSSDIEYLKIIAYRVLRGFKAYYLEVREKEQEKISSCSTASEKDTSTISD